MPSVFRRPGSPYYYVRHSWAGVGALTLSTRTTKLPLAQRYDGLLRELRDGGRFDVLQALKAGKLHLSDLLGGTSARQLDSLTQRANAPTLLPLLDEWCRCGASDMGIRPRSMQRYISSVRHLKALIPVDATVQALNAEFVSHFRRFRRLQAAERGKPLTEATINRDLAAIGAFLSWCKDARGIGVEKPTMHYARESRGRVRALSTEECRRFWAHCPADWIDLFCLLFTTGMTIGEALGLRGTDISIEQARVHLHEEGGRQLKRECRARELAIPAAILPSLAGRISRLSSPLDLMFPVGYPAARKAWVRTCNAAAIHGATIHDARHTFAVEAVKSGIPEARLQRLLGHSHPGTTRRYAMHSPEQFLEADADRVAQKLSLPPSVASPLRRLA